MIEVITKLDKTEPRVAFGRDGNGSTSAYHNIPAKLEFFWLVVATLGPPLKCTPEVYSRESSGSNTSKGKAHAF